MRRPSLFLVAIASGFALLAGCSGTTSTTVAPATSAPATTSAAPATSSAPATTSAPATSSAPAETTPAATGTLSEDCLALNTAMLGATSDLTKAMKGIMTTPKKTIKVLQEFADDFSAAIDKVSDPSLKKEATEALNTVTELIDELQVFVKNPSKLDTAKLQKTLAAWQKQFPEIDTVCQG